MSRAKFEGFTIEPRWWRFGGPIDFWISHHDMVEKLVKVNKIRPYPLPRPWPGPCPGGLKMPHVHLGEEVFRLEQEQWMEFSTGVIREMADRLVEANTVRFGELMDLAEITEVVGAIR
ncbi:MAG: hypothetical protein GY906_16610 [bacterium]|nr:hypothetical protein [bacterium]